MKNREETVKSVKKELRRGEREARREEQRAVRELRRDVAREAQVAKALFRAQ